MKNHKLKDQYRRQNFSRNEAAFFVSRGSLFLKANPLTKGKARTRNLCRLTNRCVLSTRSRGVFRKFKIARHGLRFLATYGYLPGVTKSSW
jgi:small subunit ribosomal protein S14